jgi:enterochelin esterase-like enzyme
MILPFRSQILIRLAVVSIATLLPVGFAALAQTNSTTPAATPSAGAAGSATSAADEAVLAADGCTEEKFTVHSPSMDRDISGLVILPPGYKDHPDTKYPVLYALHGRRASPEGFRKMIPLRAGLKDKPMIVACFDGDRGSEYLDAATPQKWSRNLQDSSEKKSLFTTFFFDEFVPYVDKTYRTNPKQRMVTGFSMGGYGALHYMLARPDFFASVSSMSGAFDDFAHPTDEIKKWLTPLLGSFDQNPAPWLAADIATQIQAVAAKGVKLPPVYLTCGTEDKLIKVNRDMNDLLKAKGYTSQIVEAPGGHDRAFWDSAAVGVLNFHWQSLQQK